MTRYYFDIRDDTGLYPDEEGLEFDTQQEAEVEAARSLANLAKDFATIRQDVSVEGEQTLSGCFKPRSFSTEVGRSSKDGSYLRVSRSSPGGVRFHAAITSRARSHI